MALLIHKEYEDGTETGYARIGHAAIDASGGDSSVEVHEFKTSDFRQGGLTNFVKRRHMRIPKGEADTIYGTHINLIKELRSEIQTLADQQVIMQEHADELKSLALRANIYYQLYNYIKNHSAGDEKTYPNALDHFEDLS